MKGHLERSISNELCEKAESGDNEGNELVRLGARTIF